MRSIILIIALAATARHAGQCSDGASDTPEAWTWEVGQGEAN